MKKIFLISIIGVLGIMFIITPTVFASTTISRPSSPITIQIIKDSIIAPFESVGSIYSSLIAYTFQLYKEGGASVYLSLKNRLVKPPAPPLIDDQVTIINGPTVIPQ